MRMIYIYSCKKRPPVPGAIPNEGLIETEEFEEGSTEQFKFNGAWGTCTYDRKLTSKEVSDYELEYLCDDDLDLPF